MLRAGDRPSVGRPLQRIWSARFWHDRDWAYRRRGHVRWLANPMNGPCRSWPIPWPCLSQHSIPGSVRGISRPDATKAQGSGCFGPMRVNSSACADCGKCLGSGRGPHQGNRPWNKRSMVRRRDRVCRWKRRCHPEKESNLSSSTFTCFQAQTAFWAVERLKKSIFCQKSVLRRLHDW